MAKRAKKSNLKETKGGSVKPVLVAFGLGLYWMVEYQGVTLQPDAPLWGSALVLGGRLFVDFVGAWIIVAALQLVVGGVRLGIAFARSRMAREPST